MKKIALTSLIFIYLSLIGIVFFWVEAKIFGSSNQNIIVKGINQEQYQPLHYI